MMSPFGRKMVDRYAVSPTQQTRGPKDVTSITFCILLSDNRQQRISTPPVDGVSLSSDGVMARPEPKGGRLNEDQA